MTQLQHIVDQRDEGPLAHRDGSPSQRKLVEPTYGLDLPEDRLDGLLSRFVSLFPPLCVQKASHPLP